MRTLYVGICIFNILLCIGGAIYEYRDGNFKAMIWAISCAIWTVNAI